MKVLKQLIDAVDKIQENNNIDIEAIVHELSKLLSHFKLKNLHIKQDKFDSEYVEKPWF
jgi:molecular chaperone GrpE (heat shock protein)